MWINLIAIGIAGGLGAVCRYGLGVGVDRWTGVASSGGGGGLPWGTFAVNAVGCLLLGLLLGLTQRRVALPPGLQLAIAAGFLGSFTTFSTFAVQSLTLAQDGRPVAALLNVLLHNVVGITLAACGYAVGTLAPGTP
jgi:CrcB protein